MLRAYAPSGSPHGYDLRMPAHFYGELAKTAEGVSLLLEKGHFTRYVDLLASHWNDHEDTAVLHKIKAALWAIGSIGATERGAPFLKDCEVMSAIVHIAEKSPIATLKGTAYLVLGMLSNTTVGIALLEEYRWQCVTTHMGSPIGICIPYRISDFLMLTPWSKLETTDARSDLKIGIQQDPLTNEIFRAMSDLSNHIVANEAAKTLIRYMILGYLLILC